MARVDKAAEAYRREMGEAAAARQEPTKVARKRADDGECDCGWKLDRGNTSGPHHRPRCPKWAETGPYAKVVMPND